MPHPVAPATSRSIPNIQKRLWRREQALLEQLQYELGREALRVVAVALGPEPRVLIQEGVDTLLLGGVVHRDVRPGPGAETCQNRPSS
jgi:hypothetical protein